MYPNIFRTTSAHTHTHTTRPLLFMTISDISGSMATWICGVELWATSSFTIANTDSDAHTTHALN